MKQARQRNGGENGDRPARVYNVFHIFEGRIKKSIKFDPQKVHSAIQ